MKKGFILGLIVGGLLFGSISVYAVTNYIYSSDEVSYTPSDTNWNVKNVNEALNSLKNSSVNALSNLKDTPIAKAIGANGDNLNSVITALNGIKNQGNKSFSITNTSAVTIPAGYYDGTGKIQTSGMMVTPTATKSITANGSNIDVKDYAKVNVSVPSKDYYIQDYIQFDSYSQYQAVITRDAYKGYSGVAFIGTSGGSTYVSGNATNLGGALPYMSYNSSTGTVYLNMINNPYGQIYFLTQYGVPSIKFILYK